jgi:hypothetical protein
MMRQEGTVMLALPLGLVFLGVTAWGLFSPGIAGWVFIGLSGLIQGWLVVIHSALRDRLAADKEPYFLSSAEIATFRKYPYYFLQPMIARQWSSVCSWLYALGIVWAGYLAWQFQWVPAAVALALGFLASNLARILNAGNWLRFHHQRGKLTPELHAVLMDVEAVEQKIYNTRIARMNQSTEPAV